MVARRFEETDETWRDRAACRGMDTEAFFPTITYAGSISAESRRRIHECMAVCARCPVTDECFAYAKHFDVRCGIWGGKLLNRHGGVVQRGIGQAV